MATNVRYPGLKRLSLACTSPTTPSSGDPVLFGQMPGIALTDEATTGPLTGQTTVGLDDVAYFSVVAVNAGGNSAVALGDAIYGTAASPVVLSKTATGVFFGYALETITSGATATILVKIGV